MIGSSENRISYNGNGIATEFAYTFKILEKSDMKVLHVAADGTETLLVSDYYVDMEKSVVLYPGYAPGAEIPEQNRPPILPVGERLVLYREVPITQESALDKHWPFNVIENGLDKLTIICQQIWDRLQRSFYVSESTSTNFDPKVPIEAGKTFRVKDDGTGFEVTEDPGKVIDGATALLKQTTEQAEFANEQAVNAQNAAKEVKEIYGDGNFTPLSDLLGGLGTKLKRWGAIFANKVFASNLPIVYNSVAEMKADAMLWEGMNTKTLGYYTPNDGGGASYLIRAKTDADVVDGGSLHVLSSGLVAELIIENGAVCPEQFGAIGSANYYFESINGELVQKWYADSEHKTEAFDETDYVQAAIDSGYTVILKKVYGVTRPIIAKEGTSIIGRNNNINVSHKGKNVGLRCISAMSEGDGVLKVTHSVTLDNIIVDANLLADYGVYTDNIYYRANNYNKVLVTRASTAAFSVNVYLSSLKDCFAKLSTIGFNMNGTTNNAGLTALTMDGCYSDACETGYNINKYIYSTMISCACDNAYAPYVLKNASISMIACGCENVSGDIVINMTSNSAGCNANIINFKMFNAGQETEFIHVSGTMYMVDVDGVSVGAYCKPKMYITEGKRCFITLHPNTEIARGSGNIINDNLLSLSDGIYTHNGITFTVTDGVVKCEGQLTDTSTPAVVILGQINLPEGLYMVQGKMSDIRNYSGIILSSNDNQDTTAIEADASSITTLNVVTSLDSKSYYIKALVRDNRYLTNYQYLYPAIIKCRP